MVISICTDKAHKKIEYSFMIFKNLSKSGIEWNFFIPIKGTKNPTAKIILNGGRLNTLHTGLGKARMSILSTFI